MPSEEPGRLIADEIFQNFSDPDGNFVEQFQSPGFSARTFELYLFAYLSDSGFSISRSFSAPDFVISNNGLSVALEATTINPTKAKGGEPESSGLLTPEEILEAQQLTPEEIQEKQQNELPIRFGGPLFSKLRKRYWQLEHCRQLPLVLAIEAFHEKGSLAFTDYALAQYLYGLRGYPSWTESGQLVVDFSKIDQHVHGEKIIPSNFFAQPDAENVSAVLFSNSGTWPKFSRMGYLAGYHRGNVRMIRTGTSYDPNPDSAIPLSFSYDLDDPPWKEAWGQGLVVIHNPNARHPIPKNYFPDAVDMYLLEGKVVSDVPRFHVYASEPRSSSSKEEIFYL